MSISIKLSWVVRPIRLRIALVSSSKSFPFIGWCYSSLNRENIGNFITIFVIIINSTVSNLINLGANIHISSGISIDILPKTKPETSTIKIFSIQIFFLQMGIFDPTLCLLISS